MALKELLSPQEDNLNIPTAQEQFKALYGDDSAKNNNAIELMAQYSPQELRELANTSTLDMLEQILNEVDNTDNNNARFGNLITRLVLKGNPKLADLVSVLGKDLLDKMQMLNKGQVK